MTTTLQTLRESQEAEGYAEDFKFFVSAVTILLVFIVSFFLPLVFQNKFVLIMSESSAMSCFFSGSLYLYLLHKGLEVKIPGQLLVSLLLFLATAAFCVPPLFFPNGLGLNVVSQILIYGAGASCTVAFMLFFGSLPFLVIDDDNYGQFRASLSSKEVLAAVSIALASSILLVSGALVMFYPSVAAAIGGSRYAIGTAVICIALSILVFGIISTRKFIEHNDNAEAHSDDTHVLDMEDTKATSNTNTDANNNTNKCFDNEQEDQYDQVGAAVSPPLNDNDCVANTNDSISTNVNRILSDNSGNQKDTTMNNDNDNITNGGDGIDREQVNIGVL